jgi:hypothetical protein
MSTRTRGSHAWCVCERPLGCTQLRRTASTSGGLYSSNQEPPCAAMTRWITNSGPILWAETALATSGAVSATWAVVIDTLYILTDTLYTQGGTPGVPPCKHLCTRSCSNKHTHAKFISRSPDGWDQIPRWAGGWACTSHPGVLGSIPTRGTRENRAPPCVKVLGSSQGSQCVMGRLVHTGLGSSSLVAHVLHYPPPPTRTAL